MLISVGRTPSSAREPLLPLLHSLATLLPRYPILIAPTRTGYSAHVQDFPGCIATGQTFEQITGRMRKAIQMHLTAMREDGDEIPQPSLVDLVEVA